MNYVTHKQLQFSPCNKLTNNTQVTSQDETLNVRSRRELGSMPTTRTRTHPRDLIVAAAMGDEDVVRRLLKCYDAKIWTEQERQDEEGRTAIMHAAAAGHESIVRLLIEAGDDVTERNLVTGGWTALMHAVYNEHESIVRLLIECGSDVNTKAYDDDLTYGGELMDGHYLWSVLMLAVQYGHESIVRLLIEAGADVTDVTDENHTALMLAVGSYEHEDEFVTERIVLELIKAGSDLNARDNKYWTALMHAAWRGHESIVRILIEAGADVRYVTDENRTALMLAACSYLHDDEFVTERIVLELIKAGCDLNARDSKDWTALMHAACRGCKHVDLLISLVAEKQFWRYRLSLVPSLSSRSLRAIVRATTGWLHDPFRPPCGVKAKDADGCTALMIAARAGREDTVRLLIEMGSDLNVRANSTGGRPAASPHRELMVGQYLWSGFRKGDTALMMAARNGHESTFHALVKGGAVDKVKFDDGKTAVQVLIKSIRKRERQKITRTARDHAQSVQKLIDEDTQQLSDGLYMKLCDMNKRAFDS